MDQIFPAAALSGAALRTQHLETVSLDLTKEVSPSVPVALDPRSIYTLSPVAADAVLSLAQSRTQAVQTAEFGTRYGHGAQAADAVIATAVTATPIITTEPTKSVSAANRNWNEDVRLQPVVFRKVGADLTVRYDNPRVMAAWSAAFPDIAGRKFRGLQVSDTHVKSALAEAAKEAGFNGRQTDIYLLCNSEKFKAFSDDHPGTKINWINIDDDDILLFWPKEADPD